DKKYKCTICNKLFAARRSLKRHKLCHEEEAAFRCPVDGCKEAFRTAANLAKHKKMAHPATALVASAGLNVMAHDPIADKVGPGLGMPSGVKMLPGTPIGGGGGSGGVTMKGMEKVALHHQEASGVTMSPGGQSNVMGGQLGANPLMGLNAASSGMKTDGRSSAGGMMVVPPSRTSSAGSSAGMAGINNGSGARGGAGAGGGNGPVSTPEQQSVSMAYRMGDSPLPGSAAAATTNTANIPYGYSQMNNAFDWQGMELGTAANAEPGLISSGSPGGQPQGAPGTSGTMKSANSNKYYNAMHEAGGGATGSSAVGGSTSTGFLSPQQLQHQSPHHSQHMQHHTQQTQLQQQQQQQQQHLPHHAHHGQVGGGLQNKPVQDQHSTHQQQQQQHMMSMNSQDMMGYQVRSNSIPNRSLFVVFVWYTGTFLSFFLINHVCTATVLDNSLRYTGNCGGPVVDLTAAPVFTRQDRGSSLFWAVPP
uniref:C2H2-type domain-containing protein n=1 Tax=Anopheles maculatus TaxID=74869 RepID=A0A182SNW8_9DIPT